MAQPTGLPGGIELTSRLVDWGFADSPLDELVGPRTDDGDRAHTGLYSQLGIERVMPRLEVILGIASEEDLHGTRALDFVLAPMRGARPNDAHRFFHAHAAVGGRHVTANFDTCIERAGRRVISPNVFHFHGSTEDDPLTLGATFRSIEAGFRPDIAEQFTRYLLAAPFLVVVGYSWSDVFDVAPLLERFADAGSRLDGFTIIWVNYANKPLEPDEFSTPPTPEPGSLAAFLAEERIPWSLRQLESLQRAGAVVRRFVGDPTPLYDELTELWALDVEPESDMSVELANNVPDLNEWMLSPHDSVRVRSTARLWRTLGVHRSALTLMEANPDLFTAREVAETRASLAWLGGRYRTAAQLWARALPRGTPAERAAWDERQIACRWVAGKFVTALIRVRFAIRRATTRDVASPELYEQWARILQHMSRTPDLRLLARASRPKAKTEIDAALRSLRLGAHMSIRLESARRSLDAGTQHGEATTTARTRFTESESLLGVVNYRHGRLRSALSQGQASIEILEAQRGWAQHLNATGDADRSIFLPAARGALTMQTVLRAAFRNQFGWLQRCRLVASAIIQR